MATTVVRYKRALKIVEKWPLDPMKSRHRDIGALLRSRIEQEFHEGEVRDPDMCDRMLASLENLCGNKYQQLYPCDLEYGSLGFNREVSYYTTSDRMITALREEKKPSKFAQLLGGINLGRKAQTDNLLEAPKPNDNSKPGNT